MILLNEIKLKNFLSHGNSTVAFKDKHQMLIDGDSGAGKSSIIDAIVWCLYGRGRSDNRSLIKRGQKLASVTLKLKDDKEYFKIERSITPKGKHELKVSNSEIDKNYKPIKVSGLKNVQDHLESEILNSSYLLFINSIVYPQDNPDNFVKQTAAKKKEILLEIIKASSYDEYYKKTKTKIDECKSKIMLDDGLLESLEPSIDQDKKFIEENSKADGESEELKIKLKSVSEKKKEISDGLNILGLKDVEINEKRERRTDLEDRRQYCVNALAAANKKLIDLDDSTINRLEQEVVKLSSLREELKKIGNAESDASNWHEQMLKISSNSPVGRNFDDEILEINKQIMDIYGMEVPKCHKCMEPYKNIAEDKAVRTDALTNRLIIVKTEKEEYVKNFEEHNKLVIGLGDCPVVDKARKSVIILEIEELENKEKELSKFKSDKLFYEEKCAEEIEEYTNETKELDKKIEVLSSTITRLLHECQYKSKLEQELEDLSNEYNETDSTIRGLENTVILVKNALSRLSKSKERYNNLKASKKAYAADLKLLVLIRDAFGSNGIKSIMIDYIIPRLEEKINSILGSLSDFRIRLDTQRGSVSGDNTVEGLFISILNESGEEFDFDNYSGSEKLRIMYAISEGLASVQRFGFRILDETLHGFDKEVEDKFTKIIFNLQQNVAQFVCVSHITSIKELFDERVVIKKINGDSVVE